MNPKMQLIDCLQDVLDDEIIPSNLDDLIFYIEGKLYGIYETDEQVIQFRTQLNFKIVTAIDCFQLINNGYYAPSDLSNQLFYIIEHQTIRNINEDDIKTYITNIIKTLASSDLLVIAIHTDTCCNDINLIYDIIVTLKNEYHIKVNFTEALKEVAIDQPCFFPKVHVTINAYDWINACRNTLIGYPNPGILVVYGAPNECNHLFDYVIRNNNEQVSLLDSIIKILKHKGVLCEVEYDRT